MSFLIDCSPGAWLKALRTSVAVLAGAFFLAVPLAQADDPGAPSGDGVQPTFVEGNPTCSDYGGYEFKINYPADGVFEGGDHPDGPLRVEIDVYNTPDGQVFDWTALNGLVQNLVVKGGPNANLFAYGDPGDDMDTLLHSPVNPNNGKYYGLSHISFCYTPGAPDIEVEKDCGTGQFIEDGTKVRYEIIADISNESSGDIDLYNVEVMEDAVDGDTSCSLTSVKLNGVDVPGLTLPMTLTGGWDDVPGFQGANALAAGDTINLGIQCDSESPVGPNTVSTRATEEPGEDPATDAADTDSSTSVCQDPRNAGPNVAVVKDCADPIISLVEVTLDDASTALAVQKCARISVFNLGGEAVTAELSDTDIPELSSPVSLGTLLANDGAPGGDDEFSAVYCYLPDMPTGDAIQLGDDPVEWTVFTGDQSDLFLAALFSNVASVLAEGVFSGISDVQSGEAHCSICYSNDENLPAACPDPDEVFPDPDDPL
ncbi:MAG: hypothetical protein HWE39_01315 [Oceanospirillaceae bacterium]|nr:hypothetical protein [Oceanospirillaceae bacterium]